jgi:hypothetical protein
MNVLVQADQQFAGSANPETDQNFDAGAVDTFRGGTHIQGRFEEATVDCTSGQWFHRPDHKSDVYFSTQCMLREPGCQPVATEFQCAPGKVTGLELRQWKGGSIHGFKFECDTHTGAAKTTRLSLKEARLCWENLEQRVTFQTPQVWHDADRPTGPVQDYPGQSSSLEYGVPFSSRTQGNEWLYRRD